MPIYEYFCQACGFKFEKLIKVENRDLISCQKCGAKATRRISVVNFKINWDKKGGDV